MAPLVGLNTAMPFKQRSCAVVNGHGAASQNVAGHGEQIVVERQKRGEQPDARGI
jgi:hypothetical protein